MSIIFFFTLAYIYHYAVGSASKRQQTNNVADSRKETTQSIGNNNWEFHAPDALHTGDHVTSNYTLY